MSGMSQTGYLKYETGENDVPTIVWIKDLMNTRTMKPSERKAQRASMISVPCGNG